MKINDSSAAKLNSVLFALGILALLIYLFLALMKGAQYDLWWFGASGLLILLYLLYRGPVTFKYDSEGEVMNFLTSDPIWSPLIRSFNKRYEFPKRKLYNYKIINWPLRRRLVIYISSKHGGYKKRSVLISYVKRNELSKLKNSLAKNSQAEKDGRRRK